MSDDGARALAPRSAHEKHLSDVYLRIQSGINNFKPSSTNDENASRFDSISQEILHTALATPCLIAANNRRILALAVPVKRTDDTILYDLPSEGGKLQDVKIRFIRHVFEETTQLGTKDMLELSKYIMEVGKSCKIQLECMGDDKSRRMKVKLQNKLTYLVEAIAEDAIQVSLDEWWVLSPKTEEELEKGIKQIYLQALNHTLTSQNNSTEQYIDWGTGEDPWEEEQEDEGEEVEDEYVCPDDPEIGMIRALKLRTGEVLLETLKGILSDCDGIEDLWDSTLALIHGVEARLKADKVEIKRENGSK